MTCRFLDSFAHYNTSALMAQKWTTVVVTPTFTTGRNGAPCIRLPNANPITKTIDAQGTWIVGGAYRVNNLPSGAVTWVGFFDSATTQCDVRLNADGTISGTRNGTVLGTSVSALTAATFYYVEVKVVISATVGVIAVNVNGANVLNITGANTKNTANVTADVVKITSPTTSGVGTDLQDFYIFDGNGTTNNAMRGDSRVQATFATANGADTGWVVTGAASKWQAVAGNPPNVANYISSAAAPDSYTATYAAPASLGVISALQIVMNAEKDDANATTIAPIVRHAGVDNVGVSVSPSNGSYLFFPQVYETNPGTGVAWTQSDVVTDEFGVKRVT